MTAEAGTRSATAEEREDRMRDRVTAFRKRRPRLIDEVVTLAHGAGGKSSAALVDAVFLEASATPNSSNSVTAPS